MKKEVFVLFILLALLLFSACAQPDVQALKEAEQTTNTVVADTLNGENTETLDDFEETLAVETDAENSESSNVEQIPEGNGTHIEEVIGEGEYTFAVDAMVSIPNSSPQEGTLTVKNIDLSLLEEYLCDGETLTEDTSDPLMKEYLSDDGSKRLVVYMDQPGAAYFNNSEQDTYYTSPDLLPVFDEELTDDQRQFLEQIEGETIEIVKNIGFEGDVMLSMYYTDGEIQYSNISLSSKINGYLLIANYLGNYYCLNTVNTGDHGIGSVNFQGFYEIGQASDVAVLSLDEIMAIVRDGVAQKNINTYNVPVTEVQLAYMVERDENNQASFYPVWCFAGALDEISGSVPFLILDARTGEVVSMAETY